MYGTTGLQAYIRKHVAFGDRFLDLVSKDDRFEILFKPLLSMLCFRLKNTSNEKNKALVDKINQSGKFYLIGTLFGDTYVIRMVIGATATEILHVDSCWAFIQLCAEQLLSKSD